MITVREATGIIFSHLHTPGVTTVTSLRATGRILAENVNADRDFPPFDRVAMDGIALNFREWQEGRRTFQIEGTLAAGVPQVHLVDLSHCIEVMTGAMLPVGCDAVIRYEDLKITGKEAAIQVETILPWQSIHRQATDARKGQTLLEAGVSLSPAEVALLTSVGKSKIAVFDFPRTAIISTGDELVDIDASPAPHQIRRSNTYALQSAMDEMGWKAIAFHLADDRKVMEKALNDIVEQYDVIILSGGVSRGKFDFVPQVLETVGVRKLFHQVSQRPGKPFWFGRSASGKVAFALPGNPVSTFMCFYRYVKPWMLKSFGVANEQRTAILASDFSFAPNLTCFLQVQVRNEGGRLLAYPEAGQGSGDFANLKNVNGFLELPLEKNDFKAGEVFPYFSFRT